MQLTSPSFVDGEEIPKKHALRGDNASPPLQIAGVPAEAKSLALIMEDVDCPLGLFTHWVIWNIPAKTTQIDENTVPPETEIGLNGFGEVRYNGPCPPSGRHRYRFRLLALDTVLEATRPDRKDHIQQEMDGHVIEEAFLIGYYAALA